MAPAEGAAGRGGRAELDEAPLPLRPRGVGDLIDAAVELLRGRFPVYLGLSALILAPVRVASYYSQDRLQAAEIGASDVLLFVGVALLLPMLVQSAVTAIMIVVVHGQLLGRRVPAGEALGRTLRRLPALLLLLLLMGVILLAGTGLSALIAVVCFPLAPLILVTMVYLGWRLYLATPALMLEGLSPVAAIRRGFGLSAGSFWRWLGVYVLSWLLAMFFAGLAGIGDDPNLRGQALESLGLPRAIFDAIYLPVSTLLHAVAVSFTAVVATTFYLDARMRREAFDLELRLARLATIRGGA